MPSLPHAHLRRAQAESRPINGGNQPGLHGDPRAFGPAESGLIERYQLLVTFYVTEPGVHVNAPRTRCACPSLLLSAANGGGVDLLRLDVLLRFPMISISVAREHCLPCFRRRARAPRIDNRPRMKQEISTAAYAHPRFRSADSGGASTVVPALSKPVT